MTRAELDQLAGVERTARVAVGIGHAMDSVMNDRNLTPTTRAHVLWALDQALQAFAQLGESQHDDPDNVLRVAA